MSNSKQYPATGGRAESDVQPLRSQRATRKDAVIFTALVLLVGTVFNAGYWCGAHADKPNTFVASVAVTLVVALVFLVQGLWRAAGSDA